MDKHPAKHFRMCVSPCQRFLTPEDLCVMCLSEENASSVLEEAECAHFEKFSMKKLSLCMSLFLRDEGQASRPPCLGTCDGRGKVENEFVGITRQGSVASYTSSSQVRKLSDIKGCKDVFNALFKCWTNGTYHWLYDLPSGASAWDLWLSTVAYSGIVQ